MKLLSTLAFVVIYSSFVSSQDYSGTLIDNEGHSIAFAHVFFYHEQRRGAISNEAGEFTIEVSSENMQDSLVISRLGYETLFIPYPDIKKFNGQITLEASAVELNEVVILSDTYLRYILKEAITAIPKNYPTEMHLLQAYYQDYTISDGEYSEMIEADIVLVSDGYDEENVNQKVYLNQLRKTEDKRLLPDRLRTDRNMLINTLQINDLKNRSFSKFSSMVASVTIDEFIEQVDDLRNLSIQNRHIQDQDTILTIKFNDPLLTVRSAGDNKMFNGIFTLISINLTDKAIVQIVHGDIWSDDADFQEIAFRKINDIYYPSYMRKVTNWEYDKETHKHYNSRKLFFYDTAVGKDKIKKYKKGKKMNSEKGLRLIKKKTDDAFWSQYTYANTLTAATIIRSKFGMNR